MQTRPLDVFGCPLAGTTLIEASAGTGKTWAICGLYLRLLLEQRIEVPRLLVVTFTNAATAELRERIRARLAETLAALREGGAGDPFVVALLGALRERGGSDESMRQRLQQALHEFDEAAIFTIHGFCQRALADAPFAAGLPLAQQAIADDGELRLAVVRDFWRRRIAGDDALPPLLAAQLLRCKDNPERWARLLARRVAKPLSRVVWPTGIDAPAAVDADALAAAFAAARAEWQRDAVVDIVREALPRLNGNVFRPATVDAAAQGWEALFTAAELPIALPDRLDLFTPARLKPKKNQAPPRPHPFFAAAGRLHEACGAAGATLALHRLRLLRELLDTGPRELRAAKRARRVAAFDDLLFDVFERLGEAAFAAALAERFPAALIDEFQDTDPLQSAIFRAVYGGRAAPLFLVGDPKQAIYSFRNADLHTYLRSRDAAQARFTLSDNQRSSPALIEALNALFGANRRAFMLPGLEATPATVGARPRKAFADASALRAALQLWSLPDAEPLDKPAALRRAMDACAGEIARLLGAAQRGAVLHDGRPLAAGDIAVLVRSHAHGAAMRRALAALGVGSVELSQASIYDSPDAEEVERVLLAVLEPARERLLRAALATEAMGRDAAALDALGSDEAALLAVVTRFAGYRASWLARGVGVMLREWMAGEGVAARLLGRPDGERRLTNLLHLAECLQEAAEVHAAPEALLRWLQAERRARRGDDAVQLRLESDRHLVQIVTIHKAKGLEYPIVFCPFLCDGHAGAPPNGTEGREYHDDAGEPVIDFGLAEDPAVKRRIALERAAESLRLVYVALTRAVQRCYLVVGRYRVRGSTSEACRSLLNWLVAGDGLDPAQWLTGDALAPERIDAAWRAFAAAHAGAVGLAPLPAPTGVPLASQRPRADAIAALPPPRVPHGWWIGSYSSLTQGMRHEAAAVDHDLRLPAAEPPRTVAAVEGDDILRFPRGAHAGECLHAVFEHADFADRTGWPAAIANALRLRPPAGAADAPGLPRMLERMLEDVLHTPLAEGIVLAGVPRARRLVELEFHLPAARFGAGALAAALRQHGYPVPALAFGTLEGYLHGFIDLVFEHDGRFHLVDWKSNYLGDTPADYGPPALVRAMAAHAYQLQALLYAVALHRHLRHRLRGYRYDEHFGSVQYLFVRGVRPHWHNADGSPCGVHALRPARQTIEQLSALFDTAQAPR